MDAEVLIVGAGPTGLALAVDLARRGVDHRVVDRAAGPFPGSRGKGLQPRSVEVLHDLGVEVLVADRPRFRAYDGARVVAEWDPHEGRVPTPATPFPSTVLIPQFRVEAMLRARLAELGGAVEYGVEVSGFEQDATGVTAVVGGDRVRVAYLVGCDGGRSSVRKALGVGFAGETWDDQRMVVGDVRLTGLDRDHWHTWPHSPAGMIGLCPLPGTDLYQLQAQADVEPSLEVLRALVRERTGRDDVVVREATWMSLYRANVRMVDRFRVGRVFLAGDAAHVHSPAGAQGMNTGIQDAYNLGWKLAAVLTGAGAELLDTYEAERLPVAARVLGLSSDLHRQVADPDVRPGTRPEEVFQLGVSYRGGPLAGVGERAGDRAPDAPCELSDGTPTTVFNLLRGPEFVVLGLGVDDALAMVRDAHPYVRTYSVVDVAGHVEAGYGVVAPGLVLVRPDGHVALTTADASVVVAYLDQVLG
ncbi:FAD-dependent monooxygenase [Saccharothrix obliqua]|uniref:FAD-dependent monooxygenase n=1 Tax=Saccharothrix obliqua TaxID=2861747 RepID=UPI001C5F33E1|nr:FAD-dependent monooxygenase [Saccharothrix obliqua]MBW4717628.1 FAD-dependent monooxygenase [Saccharothrix obliqua]